MRLRHGIIALALAASLTACGSDDSSDASSDPSSNAPATSAAADPTSLDPSDLDTAKCAKFLAGQSKAAELSSQLTPGSNVSEAIEAANAQFEALKEGAPEDIRKALDGVKAAYTALGKLYENPSAMTADASAEIQASLKDLQANALKLNEYITENCTK